MAFPDSKNKAPNVFLNIYDKTMYESLSSIGSTSPAYVTRILTPILTSAPDAPTDVVAILILTVPAVPTDVVAKLLPTIEPGIPEINDFLNVYTIMI